jgi:ABC-type sugar transport system ATPase subunit
MSDSAGLSVRDLRFSIGAFALSGLSLEVRSGEYFVLSGPNGAGKTVLMRLVCGILRPHAGEVLVAGERVTDTPPWKRGIGYVPQEGYLFPHLTVLRNAEFGPRMRGLPRDERRRRAEEALDMLGVAALAPRAVKGLSGGERQKVALARALAARPRLLLLDEPVSAIDEAARDTVCRELKALQRRLGITTVHVSHNSAETALVADRVGRIDAGRMVTD